MYLKEVARGPCLSVIDDMEERRFFSERVLEKAKKYKGHRFRLREKAELDPSKIEILECVTQEIAQKTMHAGFLWKLHRPHLSPENDHLYLFAATHCTTANKVLMSELFHPAVWDSLRKCKILYVEFEPDTLSTEEIDQFCQLMDRIKEPDSKTCSFLTPYHKELYYESFSNVGLDTTLLAYAREWGCLYEVRSLESIESQIRSLEVAVLSYETSNLYSGEYFFDLMDTIQESNLEQLAQIYEKALPEEVKQNFSQRNQNMAESIRHLAQGSENALCAIGTFHFMGDEGFLSLLKDYTLERIV